MFTAYLIVAVLAAAANIFSATCDFVRYKQVSIAMAKAGVPESWMTRLGILKAAGALGLLAGIGMPLIGTAAAVADGLAVGVDSVAGLTVALASARASIEDVGVAVDSGVAVAAAVKRAGQPPKGAKIDIRGQIPPMTEMTSGLSACCLSTSSMSACLFVTMQRAIAAGVGLSSWPPCKAWTISSARPSAVA